MGHVTISQNLCLSQLEEQAKHVGDALGIVQHGDGCCLSLPLRIQGGCNLREHYMERHKRVMRERGMVAWGLFARFKKWRPMTPLVVTITRLAPRKLDDDNNVAGCKAVRDEVAAWLGVDDADPRVTWRYAQERSKTYAVRISIEES